jgi:hypothetical protein
LINVIIVVEPELRLAPDLGNVVFVTAKGKRGAFIAKIDFQPLYLWNHAEHVRGKARSLINLAIAVMVLAGSEKTRK